MVPRRPESGAQIAEPGPRDIVVRINGQQGADTFNVSRSGTIDAIDGWVVLNGGSESDVVNVDDAANTANKAGTLTSSTLRGLEMPAGVDYSQVEDFNLWLGTGTDGLFIDSTHGGTTDIYAGDGNATDTTMPASFAARSAISIITVTERSSSLTRG